MVGWEGYEKKMRAKEGVVSNGNDYDAIEKCIKTSVNTSYGKSVIARFAHVIFQLYTFIIQQYKYVGYLLEN